MPTISSLFQIGKPRKHSSAMLFFLALGLIAPAASAIPPIPLKPLPLKPLVTCQTTSDGKCSVAPDQQPPTRISQIISFLDPSAEGNDRLLITLSAADAGSGVREVRALINPDDDRGALPRGYLSWQDESLGYLWPADQLPCTGGGFASKHPTRFNPASISLAHCAASGDGAQRTVKFTLELNPSSGGHESIHDVFFWARDFNLNGTSWQRFDPDFVINQHDPKLGEHFGYSGINDTSQLAEVESKGIPVNLAFLMYLNDATHPHYWRTVETGRILQYYRTRGVRAVAVFENFLFEIVTDADSPCFNQQTYRLRADWRPRLGEFVERHGSQLNPEDVAMILMQSEVNDRCAVMSEVVEASEAVRQYFPDIPLTLAYGATHDNNGIRISMTPPASFPDIFEGIGIFSYSLYNVNHPLDPRNATDRFYNPRFPEDPLTVYGDLLAKLKPHQKVHLIFDAHFSPTHQALGWAEEDLAMVALNYADFMASRPEIATLVGFHWRMGGANRGMNQLPQLTIDTNIAIACNYFSINCDNPGRL